MASKPTDPIQCVMSLSGPLHSTVCAHDVGETGGGGGTMYRAGSNPVGDALSGFLSAG